MNQLNRNDIALELPAGWRESTDPDHGILVCARAATTQSSGFVPTVVLDTEPVDVPLDRWQRVSRAQLASLVEDFDEEDSADFRLGGEEVHYRRIAFRSQDHDLLCEQWCWLINGVGFTLSATVARQDFADYADLFENVAASFSVL